MGLTAIGIVAALAGTTIVGTVGLAETAGVDWIELFVQVGLAAAGISVLARRSPERVLQ